MDKTVDLLVYASTLPLSVIIVSVDFAIMNRLDGDNGLYATNGAPALRDIVRALQESGVQRRAAGEGTARVTALTGGALHEANQQATRRGNQHEHQQSMIHSFILKVSKKRKYPPLLITVKILIL